MTSLEHEHTAEMDAKPTFTSSNGMTTTSLIEWEVATAPLQSKIENDEYPERADLVTAHPEWRRVPCLAYIHANLHT